MEKIFSPHLKLAKSYWKDLLKPSDLAIDATCGNGHDTLFLAEICSVIGLDIQSQAIESTQSLLEKHQKKALLYHMSHADIDTIPLPRPPKLIVYNLGYLPRGDKSITTMVNTTVESVEKSLTLLAPDGALSITCYPGHEEGKKEEEILEKWIAKLDLDKWSVAHHKWKDRSPSLIWITAYKFERIRV